MNKKDKEVFVAMFDKNYPCVHRGTIYEGVFGCTILMSIFKTYGKECDVTPDICLKCGKRMEKWVRGE